MNHLQPPLSVMYAIVKPLLTQYIKQGQVKRCNVQQQPTIAVTVEEHTAKGVP